MVWHVRLRNNGKPARGFEALGPGSSKLSKLNVECSAQKHMGVSENRGPECGALNSRILIRRTPK